MKLKIKNPNITQISVIANPGDFFYGKCNWAEVAFDSDSWRMTAASDSGDFSYTWSVEHGNRTFLKLMSEIDKQYLLDKISSLSQFDLEETKESFIANNELDEEQKQFITGLRGISSAEIFINELEESELFEHWSEAYEYIQYDYPARAKAFVDVFIGVIQPALKHLFILQGDEELLSDLI